MQKCLVRRGTCVVEAQLLFTERNCTALYRGDSPASIGVYLSAYFLPLCLAPAILVQAICTDVLPGDIVALLHNKDTQSGLAAVRSATFLSPSDAPVILAQVTSTSVHPGVIVTSIARDDKTHSPVLYVAYKTIVGIFGKSVVGVRHLPQDRNSVSAIH